MLGKELFDVIGDIASLRGPEAAGLYNTLLECDFITDESAMETIVYI